MKKRQAMQYKNSEDYKQVKHSSNSLPTNSESQQNANGKAIYNSTKCSTSLALAIKEIHINVTTKYFLAFRLQNKTLKDCLYSILVSTLIYCWWECELFQLFLFWQ